MQGWERGGWYGGEYGGDAGHWRGKEVRFRIRLSFCVWRLSVMDSFWVSLFLLCFSSKCIRGQLSLSTRICIFPICMNSLELWGNLRFVCAHVQACVRFWRVRCNLTSKIKNLSKQSNKRGWKKLRCIHWILGLKSPGKHKAFISQHLLEC